jgi:phosphatidate cytidylyltransferase
VSNLTVRILVALVGIPLLLFTTVYGSWALLALVVLLQVGMLWEWRRLAQARQIRVFLPGVILASAGLDAAILTGGEPLWVAIFVAALGLAFLFEVFRPSHTPLVNLGSLSLFLSYIVLPLGLWTVLGNSPEAARFSPAGALTLLFVTTWCCDSGAYFTGRAIGKHKLYTAASPNKTVEGFVGGLFAAAIILPVASLLKVADPSALDYVVFPIVVGIAGQLGDLLESLMKREVQIKDSSAILPGHGGFLDRFDSLLLSTPFLFVYLNLHLDLF